MFNFMGLVAQMFTVMVVSSSPVRGSRTLQCGIRAHIAAWASMGHEESVTEVSFPLPNRGKMTKSEKMIRKFQKKFLSMKIIGWLRLKPIPYVR